MSKILSFFKEKLPMVPYTNNLQIQIETHNKLMDYAQRHDLFDNPPKPTNNMEGNPHD